MFAPLVACTAGRPQPAEVFPVFQRLLTSPIVTALVAATGKRFYRRLFPQIVILWGFIYTAHGHKLRFSVMPACFWRVPDRNIWA